MRGNRLITFVVIVLISIIVFVSADIFFPSLRSKWDSKLGAVILVVGLSLIGIYRMLREYKNK